MIENRDIVGHDAPTLQGHSHGGRVHQINVSHGAFPAPGSCGFRRSRRCVATQVTGTTGPERRCACSLVIKPSGPEATDQPGFCGENLTIAGIGG